MTPEKWRKVEGWPYEVSDRGRVRNASGRILRPRRHSHGYRQALLCNNGRRATPYVHHLVLEAFGSQRPQGKTQCNHKNGDKADNRLENLEWVTALENVRHSRRMGLVTDARGETVGTSKLTEREVIEIRAIYARMDVTFAALAREYGVHHDTVNDLVRRRTWRHLP